MRFTLRPYAVNGSIRYRRRAEELGYAALGLIAIVPNTRRKMERRRRIVITTIIVLVVLFFVHPYLFGLPGRMAEMMLLRQVHRGITQSELIQLTNKYGGEGPYGFVVGNSSDEGRTGTVVFQFTDIISLCIEGGKRYIFHFAADGRLATWKTVRWESAC